MNLTKKKWNLLELDGLSLLEQLQLEEALLRLSNENFCLINYGREPTLVMGISGKKELFFHDSPYPIIRRYSGGGAVLVDEGTLLISFIGEKREIPWEVTPASLHEWVFSHWKTAFQPHALDLIENDYCLGQKKIGGNAQYLTRNRFVHHSTFLWDFSDSRMSLLKMPPRTPTYRRGREHGHFLGRLRPYFDSITMLINRLISTFGEKTTLERKSPHLFLPLVSLPHRRATELLP
jgi:lipoate---protein ligase